MEDSNPEIMAALRRSGCRVLVVPTHLQKDVAEGQRRVVKVIRGMEAFLYEKLS